MISPSVEHAKLVDKNNSIPRPTMGELHLWTWVTNITDANPEADKWLDADEHAKFKALATSLLKQRHLAAHAGLRLVLAQYENTTPENIQFRIAPLGKPCLASDGVEFNMSHSADRVLLAVSLGEVGVDIEQLRPVTALNSLAKKHFAPSELAQLDSLDIERQHREFFQTWTRKEAVVKLTGLGLRAGVRQLDTQADSEGPLKLDLPAEWQTAHSHAHLLDIAAGEAFAAAVATTDELRSISSWRLT